MRLTSKVLTRSSGPPWHAQYLLRKSSIDSSSREKGSNMASSQQGSKVSGGGEFSARLDTRRNKRKCSVV